MEGYAIGLIIPLAVVLDLCWGDPESWPHPVRWMGAAVSRFEPMYRKWFADETAGGALFALSLIVSTWVIGRFAVHTLSQWHPLAGMGLEAVMVYYAVSIKSLKQAALAVRNALVHATLEDARRRVAEIVGRETRGLDAAAIIRAAVESVAENLVDGVLSPLFYALVGGGPLAMTYKMVNTLDSMVGYRNPAYRQFGKVSARIDDVANFIPARLSVVFIAISAQILEKSGYEALRTALREGNRHTSPNAGWPEAAFAGALGMRLGGPSEYHGRIVQKPIIGKHYKEGTAEDIYRACRLMQYTALMWVIALCGIYLFFV